jgi:hypothetical protein
MQLNRVCLPNPTYRVCSASVRIVVCVVCCCVGRSGLTTKMLSLAVHGNVVLAPARASAQPATCSASPRAAPRCVALKTASLASSRSVIPQRAQASSRSVPRRCVTAAAAPAEAPTYETYEVNLEKPLQVKFGRGNDGGAYVVSVANAPGYEEFEIGDKISKVRCVSFSPRQASSSREISS